MIRPDQLTAALLADDPAVDQALARAAGALAAWRSFPGFIRDAYPLEAGRLARRAAAALLELVEAARAHEERGQEVGR